MTRMDAIKYIAEELRDQLVICNLGFPSQELYNVKDSPAFFYMLGSIGLASSIGLGLAESTTKKVVVIDGDGSLLYNLGSLVTVATQKPENFFWIVLDNESHGSTGFQRSYDASVTSLEKLASAAGFTKVTVADDKGSLKEALKLLDEHGPLFLLAKIEKGNAKVDPIPLSPASMKSRFMEEVKKG